MTGAAPQPEPQRSATPVPLALYVHIPFCETKCPYCDFNTYAGIEAMMPAYVRALEHEIAGWGQLLPATAVASVFFGGGTPSYLPTRDVARLMRAVHGAFAVTPDAEVTLEANPGDCTVERLRAVRGAGFNRISIGVQSLDDTELRLLGRRHDAARARQAVGAARQAGFANVNVDLIFALPHQFVASWEHTLDEAIALAPDHVSAYALTLESGTPMDVQVRKGELPEPDPDIAAEMYRLAQERLASAGYAQYEVSNWARPGMASRHNLAYWRSGAWLGVGPGAHSALYANGAPALAAMGADGVRFAVMKPPREYVRLASAWAPQADGPLRLETVRGIAFVESVDALSRRTVMGDTMMMGLRLNEGVADDAFAARFGVSIANAFPRALAECMADGLVGWHDGSLRLTERGRLVGNVVFERFIADGKPAAAARPA